MFKSFPAVMTVVVALGVPAPTGQLLPDLRQAPVGCPGGTNLDPAQCQDWDVCLVADASKPRGPCLETGPASAVRLRFTTSADNVGDGPLVIYAQRSADEPTMRARQAFQSGVDGTIPDSFDQAQRDLPATVYYEPSATHEHWHLLDFEHFMLRTPDGRTVVTDRKNGFCLGDRYTTADAADLPARPQDPASAEGRLGKFLRANMCKRHDPAATSVKQGISVGWGDDYGYKVDFQWLDLTRVPSGVYDVVNVVNADRSLVEKSYDNNVSSIAIALQWPWGARNPPDVISSPPHVKLIRSCPGRERCAVAWPP
ncbi:lysyl oxidase family protein [Saccharothrix variisporea]|uniref:Lysyl oxidase n=1 Tax=Saccharothrix variisporea TaxID=543527 RepID=A0A495X5N3_9PSEU|nr:lysyl oxidase family protein [Saccharothrix variisporea]RKT66868.1 lysyl oxidase [Saccharothrix variisporea]